VLTYEAVAETGKLAQQKEIAALAHVSEEAVSRWNQIPTFRQAVAAALKRGLQQTPWLRAEIAAAARATRGSIRDWELYLEHGGPTSWRGALETRPELADGEGGVPGSPAGGGITQQVIVVGIPERQGMEALPPQLTLPARAAAVQTPAPK
jgi:hypothetical protein